MPVMSPPTIAGSISSLSSQYDIWTEPSEISAKTSCQINTSMRDAVVTSPPVVVPRPLMLIVTFPPCVLIPLIACCGIFSRSKMMIIELSP